MAESVYSTDGPECPHCHRQFTPDESHYYDESGYEMDCDGCEKKFLVAVYTQTSWTTRTIKENA